jgi:SWI/SNF-related matrix-associated actin-dependent regulator 1 of chromatin subfamily A
MNHSEKVFLTDQASPLLPPPHKLKPFQLEAISKMVQFLESSNGVYNAAEMGLGKSIMSIATANFFKWQRVVILCPAVMRLVWEKEIKRFSLACSPIVHVIESSKDFKAQKIEAANFVVCSYDLAATENGLKHLIPYRAQALICDESHLLKTRKTKRTKAVLGKLLPQIPKVIALSGTPITTCITDLYTWANALAPKDFTNFYVFANKYAEQTRTPFGIKYHGIRNEEELRSKIRSKFFIRYLKAEVLPELPEKQWIEIPLPESCAVKSLPQVNREQMEAAALQMAAYLESPENNPMPMAQQLIVKSIRQAQGIAKVEPVSMYIENLLEQEIPLVVFAYHTSVIRMLAEKLKAYKPVIIQGETPAAERMKAVESFQAGETNLFIGQYLASGHGVTLTRSSNAILAELDYSPATISQAISRIHRITQTNSVNIFYFVVDGSIENRIVSVLVEKTKSFEKALASN